MSRTEKPDAVELRERLTELQYRVTQEGATEPPFQNDYWDHHDEGLYVDVVTGEPLFSSQDKFDSGTGWPSFTRPVTPDQVATGPDHALAVPRVEVRSREGGSHLGHLFPDGPPPTGQRYCINSAALRFVPRERLAAEGYGAYLPRFGASVAPTPAPAESGSDSPTVAAGTGDQVRSPADPHEEVAILAAGCFWGVEELMRRLPGVTATSVGYTGGDADTATYEAVCTGRTGHAEAIQVRFDPTRISYADLLRYFFRLHDPTTRNRQGHDTGPQYRSAIFYHGDAQLAVARQVRREVDGSGRWHRPMVTEIVPAGEFYPAEEHHQAYLQKHPGGYTCHYLRE